MAEFSEGAKLKDTQACPDRVSKKTQKTASSEDPSTEENSMGGRQEHYMNIAAGLKHFVFSWLYSCKSIAVRAPVALDAALAQP